MKFDANGWLDAALEMDYLDKSMSREGYKPTHLVLHGTAGGVSAEAIAQNVFQVAGGGASAHFIIGQDGHIVQGVPCSLAAWANGPVNQPRIPWPDPVNINPNWYTISIEHCKPSLDNSDSLTRPQQLASFQLINVICDTYNIPKRRGDVAGGIVSHADFDSVNRANCPGVYPWTDMLAFINGGSMIIPHGWTYDSSTQVLTAPNKIAVHLGNAQFVLNAPGGWNPANVPLASEYGVPNGTQQPFRDCLLAWNAGADVHYAPVGQLLQNALTQIAALQAQIASNPNAITTQASAVLALLLSDATKLASDLASMQTVLTSH
jgi:hypothetical protein